MDNRVTVPKTHFHALIVDERINVIVKGKTDVVKKASFSCFL